jgi:hypothetical protein
MDWKVCEESEYSIHEWIVVLDANNAIMNALIYGYFQPCKKINAL